MRLNIEVAWVYFQRPEDLVPEVLLGLAQQTLDSLDIAKWDETNSGSFGCPEATQVTSDSRCRASAQARSAQARWIPSDTTVKSNPTICPTKRPCMQKHHFPIGCHTSVGRLIQSQQSQQHCAAAATIRSADSGQTAGVTPEESVVSGTTGTGPHLLAQLFAAAESGFHDLG